jgi:hypothetical protein
MQYRTRIGHTRKNVVILAAFLFFSFPSIVNAQYVAAWFSKQANNADYRSIVDEVQEMAQKLLSMGISDSLLATRLEEGYRKHVSAEVLAVSLRVDMQRAIQITAMLRESGSFPSDKKVATSIVEQMLIFLRAGLTQDELKNALFVAVSKTGKNQKSASRAVAALATITASHAQSALLEEDRRALVSELILSELSESQFEFMVAAKRASKSQGRPNVDKNLESPKEKGGQAKPGPTTGSPSAANQGNQGNQGNHTGQEQGNHSKK